MKCASLGTASGHNQAHGVDYFFPLESFSCVIFLESSPCDWIFPENSFENNSEAFKKCFKQGFFSKVAAQGE